MAFTKCWLAYPEIRGCRCDAISLHTELTGETIDRAKAALSAATPAIPSFSKIPKF